VRADIYNATVIAATIAAATAIFGTFMNRQGQRAERKSEVYAAPCDPLENTRELPYVIWRRQDSEPSTEANLRQLAGVTYNDVQFYLQRLQIESPLVGQAYLDLFEQTRRQYRIGCSGVLF
jgi:hypothetical protein